MKINLRGRLNLIFPRFILELVELSHCYIAGGAIRSYLNKERIDDFDFFFPNKENLDFCKEKMLSFNKVFECPQGKLTSYKHKGIKIQFISEKFYEKPEDVIEDFDFTVCRFVTDGNYLYTDKQALKDLRNKFLRIYKLQYPAATLGRFYKYQKKGYRLSEECKKDFVLRIATNLDIINLERVYID